MVDLYSAHIHQLSGAQGALLTPAHKAHTSFLKPSQLPGEYIIYTAQLLPLQGINRAGANQPALPSPVPI